MPEGDVRVNSIPCFVVLFCMFFSTSALANGGPVAWTKTSPLGAVALIQQQTASLKEEQLKININDLDHYSIKATYVVESSVPKHPVAFGVPIRWTWEEFETKGIYNKTKRDKGPKGYANGINVTLNNERVACSPVETVGPAESDLPEQTYVSVRSWCVADFELNQGRNTITLSYDSELEFVDAEYSKSALTEFEDRKLNYLFLPAGYWSGLVESVKVDVSLGPYAGLVKSSAPESMKQANGHLTWEARDVDFTKIPKLSLVLRSSLLEKNQLAGWNGSNHYINFKDHAKASASSTLSGSGKISYSPSNLLDGDPATAWCADKKSAKKSEYIMFSSTGNTFGENQKEYCRTEGLMITDGYMKNQKVYEINNKVRKIAISDCLNNFRTEIELEDAQNGDFRFSPKMIKNYYDGLDFIKDTGCFKVEILEVESGKDDDTCISEISVVTNCG